MAKDNGRRALGELGERLAAEHLTAKGYRIRERNFRTAAGEIDIVAEAGGVLAFVEVRCRRGSSMGTAAESLSAAKQRRMVEMAEAYGQARDDLPEQWRIDGPNPSAGTIFLYTKRPVSRRRANRGFAENHHFPTIGGENRRISR
ncbi:MAG: YraN family protein [Planctomycetes bacterium]|nr:YraN family protein [Planctomycetota bacterium]